MSDSLVQLVVHNHRPAGPAVSRSDEIGLPQDEACSGDCANCPCRGAEPKVDATPEPTCEQ
ncbi:MAG: hypothetical protein AAGC44_12245 [Planctomycetota bacterium]